jgi:hypothetical protein
MNDSSFPLLFSKTLGSRWGFGEVEGKESLTGSCKSGFISDENAPFLSMKIFSFYESFGLLELMRQSWRLLGIEGNRNYHFTRTQRITIKYQVLTDT